MTGAPDEVERARARQGRIAALVVAGTMVVWLAAQWLGGRIGLDARYVFLLDFAALAALFWAFVVALRLWRARSKEED
jgi:hypothetical protein